MKLKLLAAVLLFLVVLFAVPVSLAQTSPAPAPAPAVPSGLGYNVSLYAGYSYTGSNTTNNGFFASLAVPIYTFSNAFGKKYDAGLSLRGDYFTLTSPADYVVTAGPEFRMQFSKPTLLSGTVFQPFANLGIGAARSQCVSSNTCPAGSDVKTHAAEKIGGGLDIAVNSTMSIRLVEIDYIHSSLFPGGHVLVSNLAQVSAGIGLKF